MELSRFDADAEEVALEPVDLGTLIESIRAARLAGGALRQRRRSRSSIEVDPRRLERILGNFLDNAREHAGDKRRPGRARYVAADEIVIAVSDRGPGVPEDRLEHDLRPFHQGRPVAVRWQLAGSGWRSPPSTRR